MIQPSVPDLVRAIQAALPSAIPQALTTATAANDLYEAYLFAEIVGAARAQGANITYETVLGAGATELVFRTAPGQIYSTARQYTHAVIDFPNCAALEAHVGCGSRANPACCMNAM